METIDDTKNFVGYLVNSRMNKSFERIKKMDKKLLIAIIKDLQKNNAELKKYKKAYEDLRKFTRCESCPLVLNLKCKKKGESCIVAIDKHYLMEELQMKKK